MNVYRALYETLQMILEEGDQTLLPQHLLDRAVMVTGAERGFIVVRENGSFREKYQVRFDKAAMPAEQRQFSRSLVREAIQSRALISSDHLSSDPRFDKFESVASAGAGAVLVVPAMYREQVSAVFYLEKTAGAEPFPQDALTFMRQLAQTAGPAIHRALELASLEEFRRIHEHDLLAGNRFEGIIGRHPAMKSLLETVAQVAVSDATVLVRGETGTGKELIAKAIYRNSGRRDRPFVTLHCGALPETLFEAELFGHKRGAFTGAAADRAGRIAKAHGGTLFLDEVGEIPLAAQAKLLRFIQFGEFQRPGSDEVMKVDVRLIAATHRDLEQLVVEGRFRQDLYYRLNVLEVTIPPLRERAGDISLLAEHFLRQFWKETEPPQLAETTRRILETYTYPGNIRELSHIIERICALARTPMLTSDLLPSAVLRGAGQDTIDLTRTLHFSRYDNRELKAAREQATREAVDAVERAFLKGALAATDGNIPEAARRADMHRTYIYRLIAKHKGTGNQA